MVVIVILVMIIVIIVLVGLIMLICFINGSKNINGSFSNDISSITWSQLFMQPLS